MDYHLSADGLIKYRDRIYVLDKNEFNKDILRYFHAKSYSGHPGYQKTLTTMNKFYHWPNPKKDSVEFVARCLECQQVKVECKHMGGMLQLILIRKWKWEVIYMDFITNFTRTSRQHDFIMVVVNRLNKVAHFIPVNTAYSVSDVA